MPVPRLELLPYAKYLEPLAGPPAPQTDHDCVRVEDTELADADGSEARFMESAFARVTFTRGRFPRARFSEVWQHTVRWVSTDLAASRWTDADWISCVLAGVALHGAELRDVTFHSCKLNSVNLRAARLHRVLFVGCLLRDVDLGEAALEDVTFSGCTLEGVRLRGATLSSVDLRGSELGLEDGFESLRGATITADQLAALAPEFARVLGVQVVD